MPPKMEFGILGPVQARGTDVVPLPGRLQRVLLAVLLTRANQTVPADGLAEALWGEQGVSKLYIQVHRLRRALGDPARLASVAGGYRLRVETGELDAQRFEQLIDDGIGAVSNDPGQAVELLRAARRLWRDVPFSDADSPALAGETQRLTDLALTGLEELYAAELAIGRHTAIVGELAEHAQAHPLRERLQGLLMLALYRAGRQDRALEIYRDIRRILVEELGQEPGPYLSEIHHHILTGEPAPDILPAQLPHDVNGFTGREAELAELDGIARPVLISGTGGVGKTALAVHWAHRVRDRFPDGQLYVDLCGYGPDPPMTPEDVLAGFLRALGVDGTDIPTDREERAARFRSLLAGRRILVVLDNARTTEQVRPLLPGGPSAQVLVTSRDTLAGLVARDGAHRILLDRLSEPDSADLLRALAGDRIDDPAATRALVDHCARLPLALRIVAELINERLPGSLAPLAEELADTQRALDVLDAGGDPHTAVRAVFSWSYHQLPSEAARLFRRLGLHPGHDADLTAMTALLDADARTAVTALRRAHLLDEIAPGRYRAHDLLRAYAAELAASTDSETTRTAARMRLYRHYLQIAATAEDLDAERTNLVTVAEHAHRHGMPTATIQLATALRRYFSLGGYHDDALAVFRSSLTAARELGDLKAEGDAYRYIGSVHRRFGQLHQAKDRMRQALTCYERLGSASTRQLQLVNLGTVEIWLGQYADGRQHLQDALDLPDGSRLGRLGALTYLGWLSRLLGDYPAAADHFRAALGYADPARPRDRIDAEMLLGAMYERAGDYRQAQEHLEQARAIAFQTGNKLIQAFIAPLAVVYWRLGRRDAAFACIEHSLAVATRANERLVGMTVHNSAGELYRLDGNLEQALAQHRTALDIAVASSSPYDEAVALQGIGDVQQQLGGDGPAYWRRALAVFRRLGCADAGVLEDRLAKGP
ncbi:BTAD domain-containing putative transcriptional regulator [Kribbella sp. GL6]|uniref:AfsR/SARP family transcriptional regulator n=1 Tax=Kribbella sp. GL6 TaxID=3419765 RepID=UPI003D005586